MSIQSVTLPPEMLHHLFKRLPPAQLTICSSVSKAWQAVAEDEAVWKVAFVPKKMTQPQSLKKTFKMEFFTTSFPSELIKVLGGIEKVLNLPWINLKEDRGSPGDRKWKYPTR